jgi:hypothetical protein
VTRILDFVERTFNSFVDAVQLQDPSAAIELTFIN